MHTVMFFFLRYVYKNNLNVLIELWANPDLVLALSVKPALYVKYTDTITYK